MKSGTVTLALLFSVAGFTSVALAQNGPSSPPPAEHRERGGRFSAERIVARIDQAVGGLTADQKAKITDLVNQTRAQMQALSPDERREKWRDMIQQQNQQIRALLTPDQQTKFDQMPRMNAGERRHADN